MTSLSIYSESIRSALISINARRIRSVLTMLGIIIGVASVIVLVSILQGVKYNIMQQFEGLGSNSLVVESYVPLEEHLKGRFAKLTTRDVELIQYRVDGISSITPMLFSQINPASKIQYAVRTTFSRVEGTTYNAKDVMQLYARYGRFLSDSDNKTRRRVCVIGEKVRENLSLPENPVGKYIEISGEWIKIVGLMEAKGEMFGMSQDDYVLLPYNTMQSILGNLEKPDIRIIFNVVSPDKINSVTEKIRRLLRETHKLGSQEDDFKIQTPEQLMETFTGIIDIITLAMIGIVSISLLVGGIGIMNTMLVSVSERTREIGICKAIGAKRQHILLQFLIEAMILCILGGILGILIGYGFGLLLSLIPNFPPAHVPYWAVLLSFGFSVLVGIIFGIVPAAKAANLDPIDALRYE
ncbi:MAG: ABC transporter permease [Thiohalomonadales bacterium]